MVWLIFHEFLKSQAGVLDLAAIEELADLLDVEPSGLGRNGGRKRGYNGARPSNPG